ncbi:MAG: hypothetical protein E7Z69_00825 [Thermoplasmata archaeon]|nr:hypothetical protein [Thermoplasmata archaeon]
MDWADWFQDYSAIAAFGTWFSGTMTALAVILSLWITTRDSAKRIEIKFFIESAYIRLKVFNGSKNPIFINEIGFYSYGTIYPVKEFEGKSFSIGESADYIIENEYWNRIKEQICNSINSKFEKKGQVTKLDDTYYAFKIAADISSETYLTREWIHVNYVEQQSDKCTSQIRFDLKHYHKYDSYGWLPMAFMFSLLALICSIILEQIAAVQILCIVFGIILYCLISNDAVVHCHRTLLYIILGVYIMILIVWGILGLIFVHELSTFIAVGLFSIFALPILTKLITTTGRNKNYNY